MAEAEGGGGGGWWRLRVTLYPHCILTVSLQREVSAESFRQWEVVGGGGGSGSGRCWWWRVVEAEGGRGGGCWRRKLALYPHCIPTVSSLYPHCIPSKRGVCEVLRHRKVVGGGGRDAGWWQRWRAAEYEAVSSLYPHCILTVSLQREAEGGGWWGRQWKAEGGGWWRRRMALYSHCILTVSPLYPHCILTVSVQREVSTEAKKEGRGAGKMRSSKEEEEGRIGKRRRNEEEEEENV